MKAFFRRLKALEDRCSTAAVPAAGVVLYPGQDPPTNFDGPVIRLQIVDARKPVEMVQ